jgi:hypothetical protein
LNVRYALACRDCSKRAFNESNDKLKLIGHRENQNGNPGRWVAVLVSGEEAKVRLLARDRINFLAANCSNFNDLVTALCPFTL